MRPIRVLTILALAGALALGFAGGARACDLNVRESGFLNNAGGPYMSRPYLLWLFCEKIDDDFKEYGKELFKVVSEDLEGLNVSFDVIEEEKVKPEDRTTLAGMKIDLKELPVSVLARVYVEEFQVLANVKKRISGEELKALVTSPKKAELKTHLSDNNNYCVFVVVPGADKAASDAAMKTVKEAIAEHHKYQPSQKMPIVTVDRKDKKEEVFIKELNIKEKDTAPVVAMIFGKARMLVPTFQDKEITKDNILGQIAFLNHNASDCGADPVDIPNSTVDLLMDWSHKLDEKVILAIAKSGVVPDLDVSWWTDAEIDPDTGEVVYPKKEEERRAANDPFTPAPEEPTVFEPVLAKEPESAKEQEPEAPEEPEIEMAEVQPGETVSRVAPPRKEPEMRATGEMPEVLADSKPVTDPDKGSVVPVWLMAVPAVAGLLAIILVAGWLMIRKKEEV